MEHPSIRPSTWLFFCDVFFTRKKHPSIAVYPAATWNLTKKHLRFYLDRSGQEFGPFRTDKMRAWSGKPGWMDVMMTGDELVQCAFCISKDRTNVLFTYIIYIYYVCICLFLLVYKYVFTCFCNIYNIYIHTEMHSFSISYLCLLVLEDHDDKSCFELIYHRKLTIFSEPHL